MEQIRIPDEYGYFLEIASIIKRGGALPVDEINLVGGRKSAKTTTVELVEAIIALLGCSNVGMISMRNRVKDANELLEDYTNTYDAYSIPYNVKNNKSIIKILNQEIRVTGINDNRKNQKARMSGLSKFGSVDYIIVFFEERFEFSETDVKAAKEAIRSINPDKKNVQYLYINACNPWAKSSPYISYCGRYLAWNVQELREKGSQIKYVEIPLPDGKVKRAIFHYTNWRVAKDFLSEGDIRGILELWNIDKKRAMTSDYGMPGYEIGAIYTHLLQNIDKAIYQDHDFLTGGVDYGWGQESTSGKTVALFMGYNYSNGCDVYGEYVHSNFEQPKAPDTVCKEIVEFYYEQMRKYMVANQMEWPPFLRVRVDKANNEFITLLNTKTKEYGIKWLKFIPCKKFPIADRIAVTTNGMQKQQLRFSNDIVLLRQEMELAHYDEGAYDNNKRAKENDHALNAFEYGIEEFMHRWARNNGITNVAFKGDRIW